MLDLQQIDKSWTLFLDRDGVINHEKKEDYILNWNEFQFYNGVPKAVATLNRIFGKTIMVTNQKGVGKGVMSLDDLHHIHDNMQLAIVQAGGHIDRIFFCTDLNDDSFYRKPNPGMAFSAKGEFPDIDLNKSLIVGNKLSDMRFGRNAGMHTVFVATTNPDTPYPHPEIDLRFDSLPAFAAAFNKIINPSNN